MAERPTPHSLATCALIVLTHLPSTTLDAVRAVDPVSGWIVYVDGGGGGDESDEEGKDDNDGRLRYPNLVSGCLDGMDRSSDQEEEVMDAIREYVLASVQDNGGGGGCDPSPSEFLSALRRSGAGTNSTNSTKSTAAADGGCHPDQILLSYLSRTVFHSVDTLHDYIYTTLTGSTKSGKKGLIPSTSNATSACIDPDSILGIYIRKRVLGFDMLSFECVTKLWEVGRGWIDEGWDWSFGQQEEGDEWAGDHNMGAGSASWPPTARQLSSHLHSLCLNNANPSSSSATARSSPDSNFNEPPIYEATIEHLSTLSQYNSALPQLHYAKFLACLRSGERIGAVESLHRYFDYAVIVGRKEAVGRLLGSDGQDGAGGIGGDAAARGANANARGQQGGAGASGQQADGAGGGGGVNDPLKPLSRYAPLLLTMLHHSHGQYGLARKSAEEAVRVGQQSSDGRAVTLALGWLALLDHEMGGCGGADDAGQDLWSLSRSRATRHGPSSLCARSSLALARGRVQNAGGGAAAPSTASTRSGTGSGGSTTLATPTSNPVAASNLAAAWSDLAASTTSAVTFGAASAGGAASQSPAPPPHLAAAMGTAGQPDTSSAGSTPFDCPTSIAPVNANQTLNDVDQILRLQSILGSSLWDGVGRADLSALESKVAILSRGGDVVNALSATELALAASKIAMETLEGGVNNGDGGVDAGSIATGDRTAHQRCLDKLLDLRNSYPQMDADVWSDTVAHVLHDWSIRLGLEGSIPSNMSLPTSIRLHLSSRVSGSTDDPASSTTLPVDKVESMLHLAEAQSAALSSQNRYEQAMEITSQATRLASRHGLHVHHARSLLRLTKLRLDCIPSQPTLVLPTLLECLSVCEQHVIDSVHAAALGMLGKIHLLMGNRRMARSVIKAAMPKMIHAAPGDVVAEALLTLAKCYLAEVREVDSNKAGQYATRRLTHVMSFLAEAERAACDMCDMRTLREIYYLRAQTCSHLGPEFATERDLASKKFVDVSKWLRSGGELEVDGDKASSIAASFDAPSNLQHLSSVRLVAESLGAIAASATAVAGYGGCC